MPGDRAGARRDTRTLCGHESTVAHWGQLCRTTHTPRYGRCSAGRRGIHRSDEFAVINSDNYYPTIVLQVLRELGQPGAVLFDAAALVSHSNIPPDRIQAFAYCIVDDDGFLTDIVEKPPDTSAFNVDGEKLVSMNCWRFNPAIFQMCRDVPLSPRGEFELPLAVKLAIAQGLKFKVTVNRAGVLDLSRRSDIAAVTERLKGVQAVL